MHQTQGHPSALKTPVALRAQIDTNTVIVGNPNTPLSLINISSRWKINKQTSELHHTYNQIDIVDTYRVFHSTTRKCTFFSAAHGILCKIDHILLYKASLNKFKKIEITPWIISDHNRIKLDHHNKKIPRKYSNTWQLNIKLLKKKKKNGWLKS
jgi:exonuclease III